MAMTRRGDPSRRPLAFDDWPEVDRIAWQHAVVTAGIFDDGGNAAHWSAATRRGYIFAYGRCLAFLERRGELDRSAAPPDRITRERVVAYVELLKQQVASVTVWSYLSDLHNVLFRLFPDADWRWLRSIVNRLHSQARPSRPITARLRPVEEIYRAGIRLMTEAQDQTGRNPYSDSIAFRDGLMLSMLAACVLRVGNFAAIDLDHDLQRLMDSHVIYVEAETVKNRLPLDTVLPEELTPFIDRYLEYHRPRMAQGADVALLWISSTGRPMKGHHVSHRIAVVTERLFGAPIRPHLFRHCAATSLAIESPRLARMTRAILGHTTNRTGERYYNMATGLEACRRHADVIDDLRNTLAAEYGGT